MDCGLDLVGWLIQVMLTFGENALPGSDCGLSSRARHPFDSMRSSTGTQGQMHCFKSSAPLSALQSTRMGKDNRMKNMMDPIGLVLKESGSALTIN